MIHSATGEFKEHDGKKYLLLHSTENMKKFFHELKNKLKRLMVEKN